MNHLGPIETQGRGSGGQFTLHLQSQETYQGVK